MSWKSGRDTLYGDFKNDKKTVAELIFSDISNADLESNYPKTPDEVMQFYAKCYKLLYGNMIRNEDIIPEVLHIQRKLYSEELASKNVFELQIEKLKENIQTLNNVSVVDFEIKPPIYDKEFNTCDVRAVISTNANTRTALLLKLLCFLILLKIKMDFGKFIHLKILTVILIDF